MADSTGHNSNVGKWRSWYEGMTEPRTYGDPATYEIAAQFLSDVAPVEDWGCGGGGFKKYCTTEYRGIDGTANTFVDEIVDLCQYTSHAEGILLRHILEHNFEWKKVLENALRSFQKKMCLILFTPFVDETRQIHYWDELQVPDIAFAKQDLIGLFERHGVHWRLFENVPTQSQYNLEHIFLLER